ncbi:LpqB family beta-propeller domain-containing protein [Streptomyces sp. NPDC059740]|uniref:LpqB family beta-propeller domain-containing protein n=1 Tax=Streptomyces sp. NPDC059740 TaxID=3346926 RepID=UPI003656382C
MNGEAGAGAAGGGRRPRRRLHLARGLVVAACGALLAGCVSMPDSGEVQRVDESPRADSDSQVRVYGVPPRPDTSPTDIVRGFLDATTSDEADFRTARQYLSEAARKSWNPFQDTRVLQERPKPETPTGGTDATGFTVVLTGTQVAEVGGNHAYTPEEQRYLQRVHLTREHGQWRIDQLPDGLVLGLPDFQRIYRSVNKYYFASYGSETGDEGAGRRALVPDPVYLRQRIDPLTASVEALLEGPSSWLDPVTTTSFPRGTTLRSRGLVLDDSNALRLRLSGQAAVADRTQCHRMAAQLLFTAQDMSRATKVSEVDLQGPTGKSLCVLSQSEATREFGPPERPDGQGEAFFLDQHHRMVSVSAASSHPRAVGGPFGSGPNAFRSVGVSHREDTAAGVSLDGRSLYVAPLAHGSDLGPRRLHSKATGVAPGLTPPSWDGLGDLWVADEEAHGSRLLRLRRGTGDPREVSVPGLGDGRIAAVRVASDGVRVALLIEQDGHTTLRLGRVERTGTARQPKLAVVDLRIVAPQLEDVEAASWAGGSRLVVVGREAGGVQQMSYVDTDGSASTSQPLPGVDGVTEVAASEDETRPLVARAADGIVRLPPDANWKTVSQGTGPVYPG